MIYTTDKYTLNIEVSHVICFVVDKPESFINITLLYDLDTYVCRKNIIDINGFDVIARSVDNFVNYINKIMTTNELLVSFNAIEKVFTLSFVISNGIVDDTYSFDCIYDTTINKNNKEVRLLKTISTLCDTNLSSDKLDLNINIISLLLYNNKINIDNIMKSLSTDINLISSIDIDIILSLKSRIDSTLLMFAAQNGNIEIVTYLVSHGADVNLKNNYYNTALIYAVENDNSDVVTYLVEHGADINLPGNKKKTALMIAALNGNINVVTYLVSHGADINVKNINSRNALILAAQKGNIEIVTYLVEHGADIESKDNCGDTALLWSAYNDKIKVVTYLVGRGADVNLKNNKNETALMIAVQKGNIEIIKFLASVM